MNCERVYYKIMRDLETYIKAYNLESLVLGISGGIDSTVCAAICREVCDRVGIPLIGRSLPIKNKSDEFAVSIHVGLAFCDNFETYRLERSYHAALFDACADAGDVNVANSYHMDELEEMPSRTPIANGNLQARCRMMYLYDIASRHNGIVIDTDNLTEHNLGFFTIHGDQGDYKPIIGLWKTEVYELAQWLQEHLEEQEYYLNLQKSQVSNKNKIVALHESIALTPTDGLGISNSDLDQIGAKSYVDVDAVLKTLVCKASPKNDRNKEKLIKELGPEVVGRIAKRHYTSEFKRRLTPGTYRTDLNLE